MMETEEAKLEFLSKDLTCEDVVYSSKHVEDNNNIYPATEFPGIFQQTPFIL